MANEDDIAPVIVECQGCKSVYAALQWPDGEVKVIGRDGCSCGSDDLKVIKDVDRDDSEFSGNLK